MKKDRLLRRYTWMLSEVNHPNDYRPNAIKEFVFHNKCKKALAKLHNAGMSTRQFMREEYNNENIENHYNMLLNFIENGIITSDDLQYVVSIDRFMECTNNLIANNPSEQTKAVLYGINKDDTLNYIYDKSKDVDGIVRICDYRNIDVDIVAKNAVKVAINKNSYNERMSDIKTYVANKKTKAHIEDNLNKEQLEKANARKVMHETEKEIIKSNTKNDLMM